MRKKYVYIAIMSSFLITLWTYYWSSSAVFKTKIITFKQIANFVKNPIIEPINILCEDPKFITIIVTSYVGHVELRSAHRRAMPVDYLAKFNTTRIFLIAKIPSTEKYITQESIKDESDAFGDLLQGSFVENYRNLTIKHLMGLEWASTHCSQSAFILKVDDDTVFNLESTYKLLKKENNLDRNNFLMGYILNNTKPKRLNENKWYVTFDEYPKQYYPSYLSGWYYITTPNVAAKLCEEAASTPYFWIDDILVTGILVEALNIKLRQLPEKYFLQYYELLECCLRDMMTKYIRCDHVVGPNGNRNNLIYEFNTAFRNCDTWNNCTERSEQQDLKKVCINYRDRTIFSDGQPEVKYIRL